MKPKTIEEWAVELAAKKLLNRDYTQEEVDHLTEEEEREWEGFVRAGVIDPQFPKLLHNPVMNVDEDCGWMVKPDGKPQSTWGCRQNALAAAKGRPMIFNKGPGLRGWTRRLTPLDIG